MPRTKSDSSIEAKKTIYGTLALNHPTFAKDLKTKDHRRETKDDRRDMLVDAREGLSSGVDLSRVRNFVSDKFGNIFRTSGKVVGSLTGANEIRRGVVDPVVKNIVEPLIEMFYPPIDNDPIHDQLMNDSLNEIFDQSDIDSIRRYVETNNDAIQQIRQELINHNNKYDHEVVESDDSTIVHAIIDYLCSNGVDFSDRKYDNEQLSTHLNNSCYDERSGGLREPQNVSDVTEKEFKAYVSQIDLKEFEDSLNKGGLFGLLVPVYSGEGSPYVPYNKERGDEIYQAMPHAIEIIQTKLLTIYDKLSLKKLLKEYKRLMAIQKAMKLNEQQRQRLEQIKPIIQGARNETAEMRKKMLAPYIQETSEIIASEMLIGMGNNEEEMNGGKKKTRKSKKSRKTKSKPKHKKSKTHKKSKKSRK
jgi:hypothetical protein